MIKYPKERDSTPLKSKGGRHDYSDKRSFGGSVKPNRSSNTIK